MTTLEITQKVRAAKVALLDLIAIENELCLTLRDCSVFDQVNLEMTESPMPDLELQPLPF